MKIAIVSLAAALAFGAGAVSAHTSEEAVRIATEAGVCGQSAVKSAIFIDEGTISATCDVTAQTFQGDAATLLAAARS